MEPGTKAFQKVLFVIVDTKSDWAHDGQKTKWRGPKLPHNKANILWKNDQSAIPAYDVTDYF